ncbi:phage distal tail protein [Bacillus sp. T33-2]|uniref:phage distal tail protein n=1 Tax=Bacillus sp. T33-2 TaxID=2054168 RepID=UPI000C769664|nr:phage tail domain-containing protein [Bacillus sp. T33-2]PLR93188.1 hypothetical protein CVD19_19465 [Bacillus sp. T33-2]
MGDKVSWIDANNAEYPLNRDSIKILEGKQGWYMPPVSFVEDEVPFQAGSRLRNIKIQPKDFDLPLLLECESPQKLRETVRFFLRRFNPLKGDGRIRSIAPDGSQREIFCRYSKGLEGTEGRGNKGTYWQKLLLVFRAFDPFWYDTSSIVQTIKIDENPAAFFPIFPLRLASSTVFADITIDNAGDVETWPEWIITGPGENIILRNMTTGEVMSLDATIGARLGTGETIIIDTKPFVKTVRKGDGTNLFHTLSDDSSLWALCEGPNSIRIEMSNATTDTNIQLTYRNRYWGP